MVEIKENKTQAQPGVGQGDADLHTSKFERFADKVLHGAVAVGALVGIIGLLGGRARAETVDRANALVAGGREEAAAKHVANGVDMKRALDAGPEKVLAQTSPGTTFEFEMGQNSPRVYKPGSIDPVAATGYEMVDGTPVKMTAGTSVDSIAKWAHVLREGVTVAADVAGTVAKFLPRK